MACISRKPITILTSPVKEEMRLFYRIKMRIKNIKRKIEKNVFRIKKDYRFGGHPAVTRSLIQGLEQLKIEHNYNPKSINNIHETVIVLSDINALKEAIELKEKGVIKKIIAGPNLVISPLENDQILGDPAIDKCVVPSDWVKIAYEKDLPGLRGRIEVWYAGIDTDYWRKDRESKNAKNITIYQKTGSRKMYKKIKKIVKKLGYKPIIIRYGRYKKHQFKELMQSTFVSIFISGSESQGIALAESWAMNVPTLVWQPIAVKINERSYAIHSSAPYLSKHTGALWTDIDKLNDLIEKVASDKLHFNSREWVLKYMTDKHCAKRMCEIALHS